MTGREVSDPKQQRSIATRNDITAIAARHFDQFGYATASMNRIVQSSHLTKGSIYFHFPSKQAIGELLVSRWLTVVRQSIDDATESGLPAIEQIHQVFRDLAGRLSTDTGLRAGMTLTVEPSFNGAAAFAEWVALIDALVEHAILDGDFTEDSPVTRRTGWNLCAGTAGAVRAWPVTDTDARTRIGDVVHAHLAAPLLPISTDAEARG